MGEKGKRREREIDKGSGRHSCQRIAGEEKEKAVVLKCIQIFPVSRKEILSTFLGKV